MRIAIAGKGGSGKSTVAALLCRSLMARGRRPLLAVDADPNSCLPEKLGVTTEQTIGQLREELRAEPDKVPAGISKTEWIERLINQEVAEAAGFDMVVMGRQEGPDCYCYINNLLRACLEKIGQQYQDVVIDNEAGLEHLSRRSNGSVEALLLVSQPNVIGARTAGRITGLIDSLNLDIGKRCLVLNGCDGEIDASLKTEFETTGLTIGGTIPMDPAVLAFEEQRRSLLELQPDTPAAQAIDQLVETLLEEE